MTGASFSSDRSEAIGGVSGRVDNSAGAGSENDALAFERWRRLRGTSNAIGLSGWHGDAHREWMVVASGDCVRDGLSDSHGDGVGGADGE